MSRLVANRIRTPDGTVLQSFHRHDFKSHKDANGENYFTDGGISYVRRTVNEIPATDWSVYDDDPHSMIRVAFHWNSMDGPIALKDLTDSHLYAIIDTQWHLDDLMKQVFGDEIIWRIENENDQRP